MGLYVKVAEHDRDKKSFKGSLAISSTCTDTVQPTRCLGEAGQREWRGEREDSIGLDVKVAGDDRGKQSFKGSGRR